MCACACWLLLGQASPQSPGLKRATRIKEKLRSAFNAVARSPLTAPFSPAYMYTLSPSLTPLPPNEAHLRHTLKPRQPLLSSAPWWMVGDVEDLQPWEVDIER